MTFAAFVIGMALVLAVVAVGVLELRRIDRLIEQFHDQRLNLDRLVDRLEQRKETR